MLIEINRVEELFDSYFKDIYCYCLLKGLEEDDAIDIAQETFVLLTEKAEELEDINLKAWLYSVASNKIGGYFESQKVREKYKYYETDYYLSETVRNSYCLDDEVRIASEEKINIDAMKKDILGALSAEDRKLYNMIYSEHKKQKEIAEEIGISQKAVNMRAYRLNHKIRTLVKALFETVMMIFSLI